MRALLLVASAAACGSHVHLATVSLADEAARHEHFVREQCSLLTGQRYQTCIRLGPPRAPERREWAAAAWWLYESRYWMPVRDSVKVGAQVVCARYVAFALDAVVESDEQCHRVRHYEP